MDWADRARVECLTRTASEMLRRETFATIARELDTARFMSARAAARAYFRVLLMDTGAPAPQLEDLQVHPGCTGAEPINYVYPLGCLRLGLYFTPGPVGSVDLIAQPVCYHCARGSNRRTIYGVADLGEALADYHCTCSSAEAAP
jgi:hypothetical protein